MTFEEKYYSDQIFNQIELSSGIDSKEFENCVFNNCKFANRSITSCKFIDCLFNNCDLSNSILTNTQLSDCVFSDSKILGVKFNHCNKFLFSIKLKNCISDYCSFSGMKLPQVIFQNSSLKGVDFSDSVLEKSKFENCNLEAAIFESTNLKAADMSNAYNFTIDPRNNQIKNAKFSRNNIDGLLANLGIKIID